MMTHTLKNHVTGTVKFVRYKNEEFWYVCETGFEFPVPLADTKEAEFLAEDRAMLFMRWIRKHIAMLAHNKPLHSD